MCVEVVGLIYRFKMDEKIIGIRSDQEEVAKKVQLQNIQSLQRNTDILLSENKMLKERIAELSKAKAQKKRAMTRASERSEG
jgi:hypothetical protein